jgi:hypothetical protein
MNPVRGGQGPEVLLSLLLLPRRQTLDYTAFTSEKARAPKASADGVAGRPGPAPAAAAALQGAGSVGRADLKAAI